MKDDVRPLAMTKDEPGAWMLMPWYIQRIYEFTVRHDPAIDAAQVCRDFEADFGSGTGAMYGIALVDAESKVRGSLLAGIELYRGRWPFAMVYQWEKDKEVESSKELTHTCLQLVEGWARMHKLPRLRALAETEARVRLFGQIGLLKGPVVVNKELSNG